jgi:hypothetical protein
VRENISEEFPISLSESSNRFGKWLSPEDAERINKFCNSGHQAPQEIIVERQQQHSNQFVVFQQLFLVELAVRICKICLISQHLQVKATSQNDLKTLIKRSKTLLENFLTSRICSMQSHSKS